MTKIKVASKSEIAEGTLKKVMVRTDPVALFNIGGKFYATTNICTHKFCELDENYTMHGEDVECTCHGSQFNVKTGANIVPPAVEPLKTFKVSIEGEDIYVEG